MIKTWPQAEFMVGRVYAREIESDEYECATCVPIGHMSGQVGVYINGEKMTPIDSETRSVVDTATAARHLNRRPQTLRAWSCAGNGPIKPIRINGRLAWKVADLKALLSGQVVG